MSKHEGAWKRLLGTLKGIAPTLVAAAGTAVGGPVGGAMLATLAKAVTGKSGEDADLDDVATQLLASPELKVKFEELALKREQTLVGLERARLEADAVRQRTVNETMRAEARAEWWFQAAWRPVWGFLSAIGFFTQAAAVAYLIVTGGNPKLLGQLGSLSAFWGVAGAVLGISAWHRGIEKRIRVGGEKAGMIVARHDSGP